MTSNNESAPAESSNGEETHITLETPKSGDPKTTEPIPETLLPEGEAQLLDETVLQEEEVMQIPQLDPDVLAAFPELAEAKDSLSFLKLATARIETAITEMPSDFPNAELILGILRKNIALLEKQPEKARIIDTQASTRQVIDQVNGLSQASPELAQLLETQFQLEMVSSAISNAYDEYSTTITELTNQVSKLEADGRPEDKEALQKEEKVLESITTQRKHLSKMKEKIRAVMSKLIGAGCMKWAIGSLIAATLTGLAAFAAREMVLNRKIRRISKTALEVADKAITAHENTLEAMSATEKVLQSSLSGLEAAREGGQHSVTANLYTMTALSEHTDNEQEYLSNVLLYQVNTLEARLKLRKLLLLSNETVADRIMPHSRLIEGVKGMEINYLELVARAYASQQYRELLTEKKNAIETILTEKGLTAQQRAERIQNLPAFSQSRQMDSSNRIFSLVRMTGSYLDHHTEVTVSETANPNPRQAAFINLQRESKDTPLPNEGALSRADFALAIATEGRDTRVLKNKSLDDEQFNTLFDQAHASGNYELFSHSVLSRKQFGFLVTELIKSQNLSILEKRVRSTEELQTLINALGADLQGLPPELLVRKHISESSNIASFSEMFQYLSNGSKHMIGNIHGWSIKDAVMSGGQRMAPFAAYSASLHNINSTQIDELEEIVGKLGDEVVEMSAEERSQVERSQTLVRDIKEARGRMTTALQEEKVLLEQYRKQAEALNKYYDMDDKGLWDKLTGDGIEGLYDYFVTPHLGPGK